MRVLDLGASLLALGLVPLAGCSGGTAGIVPGTSSVTLLDVQVQVFSPRCALSGCHTGPSAPFGLDLSAGASGGNLVGVPSGELPAFFRVEPFNAADSYLYMKLTADPRIGGDAMPLSGGPLDAADLALVRSWIDEGAL